MGLKMDWIKTIAPLLGTALAGPFAGIATSFIADKLGVEAKTVEGFKKAISNGQMTPEQLSAMKQAEFDFQKYMEQNSITREQLAYDNTKDARAMYVSTKSTTPAVLTYLITLGFFGIMGFMMTDRYTSSEPLLVMLGSLGTAWIACVNYWFGSTSGSKTKTELLAHSGPVS
jgi:hypothetical protein